MSPLFPRPNLLPRTVRCLRFASTISNTSAKGNTIERSLNLRTPSTSRSPSKPSWNSSAAAQASLAARSAELRERARSVKQNQTDMELRRSIGRRWKPGDVYSPKDLGDWEQSQWLKKRRDRDFDVFKMIGKDPREFYRNFTVMSEFLTDSGALQPRSQTGLSPRNYKRLLKAVRRARGCGLIPTTYIHPQLLSRSVGGAMNR